VPAHLLHDLSDRPDDEAWLVDLDVVRAPSGKDVTAMRQVAGKVVLRRRPGAVERILEIHAVAEAAANIPKSAT
jgi:hypothetical protein